MLRRLNDRRERLQLQGNLQPVYARPRRAERGEHSALGLCLPVTSIHPSGGRPSILRPHAAPPCRDTLVMMNLINEEAETLPVGTLLDLTPVCTAELHVVPPLICVMIFTLPHTLFRGVTFFSFTRKYL